MPDDFRVHAEGDKNRMNIRTKFYGKSYMYKDKVIGVCNTFSDDVVFMVGHTSIRSFPMFKSVAEAQTKLDEFARSCGLTEAAE